jgi:hypothetical protein
MAGETGWDDMSREQAKAVLNERWAGKFEIWYVPLAVGGSSWSARRIGDSIACVIRYAPRDLHERLTDLDRIEVRTVVPIRQDEEGMTGE